MNLDNETNAAFVKHIKHLEQLAIAGDMDANKSLACMALLVEGWSPTDPPGDGVVIDFAPYLRAA